MALFFLRRLILAGGRISDLVNGGKGHNFFLVVGEDRVEDEGPTFSTGTYFLVCLAFSNSLRFSSICIFSKTWIIV